MSFLWSVEKKSEKSRKREISPDNSDAESEVEKKTPKVEKKGLKRPIESEKSDKSDDEAKRIKNSSTRNEITSSLSSSVQKKKRSANFDSDDEDDDQVDFAPKKVLKSETEIESEKPVKPEVEENSVELIPTVERTKLKFSRQLSPQKILKNISLEEKEEQKSTSSKSDNFSSLEDDQNKLIEKKDIITDAKALLADQEKTEERGKKLLEAFDD